MLISNSKYLFTVSALAAAALLGGCAAMERTEQRNEARQLAWTGPGMGPCAFGGVTERADEHCAMVSWGPEGVLHAVNSKVRARLPATANCVDHVEKVRQELARHTSMKAERIYSCPQATRSKNECHVSVLVTTADQTRFVLDNGSVVVDQIGADGVTTLAAFERQVEGAYWVGFPPSASDFAALEAGRKPAVIATSPR